MAHCDGGRRRQPHIVRTIVSRVTRVGGLSETIRLSLFCIFNSTGLGINATSITAAVEAAASALRRKWSACEQCNYSGFLLRLNKRNRFRRRWCQRHLCLFEYRWWKRCARFCVRGVGLKLSTNAVVEVNASTNNLQYFLVHFRSIFQSLLCFFLKINCWSPSGFFRATHMLNHFVISWLQTSKQV